MIEHKKVSFFWKQYWRHALRHSLGGPPGGSSTQLSFAQRGYMHGTCILTKPPHSWSHNGHAVPESYKSQKINPKESHSLCASPVGNVNLDSVLSFLCVILYLSKKKQQYRETEKQPNQYRRAEPSTNTHLSAWSTRLKIQPLSPSSQSSCLSYTDWTTSRKRGLRSFLM